MSLSLRKLLNIVLLDLEFIEKYYALVNDETVFNELEDIPLGKVDTNMILYQIFSHINNKVFERIKNRNEFSKEKKRQIKINNICDKRISEFSPYLNCIASCFNNEIDQVSIEDKPIEEIATEVYLLLLEGIQGI